MTIYCHHAAVTALKIYKRAYKKYYARYMKGNMSETEFKAWAAQAAADRAAAKQVAEWKPEVLIITSPHQIMYADYFHISPGRGAAGDMSAFGVGQTKLTVEYDSPLRDGIIRCGESADLHVGTLGQRDPYLDHGTFVPLYFLREAGVDCPILRIGLSGFSPLDHYRLGQCISQAVESLGRGAVSCGGDYPPDSR